MPHIIVKLWPGKTDSQKQALADAITKNVTSVLDCKDESVSVGFEEVTAKNWKTEVYQPDIIEKPEAIFKKPGYSM